MEKLYTEDITVSEPIRKIYADSVSNAVALLRTAAKIRRERRVSPANMAAHREEFREEYIKMLGIDICREVFGTGVVGAMVAYPLMKMFYGLDAQSPFYYIPFYTPSAVVGGCMGVAVLLILKRSGVLSRMLTQLDS